jgi:hypothetical protein
MSQKSQRKTNKVSAKVSVRKSGKVVAKAQAKAVGKGKVVAVAKKHSKRPTKKQMRGGNGYSMAVDQDRVGGQTVRKRYTECPEGGVFAALSKLWQ